MNYKERAKEWYKRALQEKDEFVKFVLLYIAFEVSVKLKFNDIREIKHNDSIKKKFYDKIDQKYLAELKHELDKKPHQNMNPNGDRRWNGKLNSVNDFDGIVEFVIRARNNLFHGDKGPEEERDVFIVKSGTRMLPSFVEAII